MSKRRKSDPVTEAGYESFPASDPPSWTLGPDDAKVARRKEREEEEDNTAQEKPSTPAPSDASQRSGQKQEK